MKTILILGASGLVGSSLVRRLYEPRTTDLLLPTRSTLDLLNPLTLRQYARHWKPDEVYMAAGKVGGIASNAKDHAGFFTENMQMALNVFTTFSDSKIMYFGSSCAYPRAKAVGSTPDDLGTGLIEPSNEGYGVAKTAAIQLAKWLRDEQGRDIRCVMPCNLSGPNDTSDHVIPDLLRKFKAATDEVRVWGDGTARREFLFVDDMVEAAVEIMAEEQAPWLQNIGCGFTVTIRELVDTLVAVTGFEGTVIYEGDKPVGTPWKSMSSRSFQKTNLRDGLELCWKRM